MAVDRITNRIEKLIQQCDWKAAQALIERQLSREPDDHWLWSRLADVKYERRNYQAALEAAEKALAIVPDCPLALWSKAGAVEMLSRPAEAFHLYFELFRRGLQQLKSPDDDANECWEGPDWTASLVADCAFLAAGCLAKTDQREKAVELYQEYLGLGIEGIFSHQDAVVKLKKLMPSKKARREAAVKVMGVMEMTFAPTNPARRSRNGRTTVGHQHITVS